MNMINVFMYCLDHFGFKYNKYTNYYSKRDNNLSNEKIIKYKTKLFIIMLRVESLI